MQYRANCKINIGLKVVRKRGDGYHDLQTVMFPVMGLYDIIDIERTAGSGAEFVGRGIVVDCKAEDNLCVRAYDLMRSRYDIGGVRITLDKRIPFGAGLGGGSADATAGLIGINDLFGLRVGHEEMIELAAQLGSDTAFFVRNTPQYCTGRGEIMEPVELRLGGYWLAVAKPDEGVSTREAYSGVEPHEASSDLRCDLRLPVDRWRDIVVNDFEPHVMDAHPRIAALKRLMYDSGALYASMSGSGSAVFGIFADRPDLTVPDSTFVHCEKVG